MEAKNKTEYRCKQTSREMLHTLRFIMHVFYFSINNITQLFPCQVQRVIDIINFSHDISALIPMQKRQFTL